MQKNYGTGLKKRTEDKRDIKSHKVLGVAHLTGLPENYDIESLEIYNQGSLDFCSAFATTSIAEDEFSKDFSPEWFFAQIKDLTGDWQSWGAELRDAMKAGCKRGFLPKEYLPFDTSTKDRNFLANPANWSESLKGYATEYQFKSFAEVTGPYDMFDNIRSTLWQNREARQSILAGTMWRDGWFQAVDGIIPSEPSADYEGHAIKIRGWTTMYGIPYLVIQNSWGKGQGKNGLFFFPREVVNRDFPIYGAYSFTQYTKDEARKLSDARWTILAQLYIALARLVLKLKYNIGAIFK